MNQVRNQRGKADQRAVNSLHHRRQQVFVVAGEQRLGGIGVANRLDVARVFVHLALAHLEGPHVRQLCEIRQQARRIRSPRPRRIDMHDQRQPARLADRVEIIEAVLGLEAEAQPVMRRHDVEPRRTRFLRPARLLDRVVDAFAHDRRDDRTQILHRGGGHAGDLGALERREREDLARMAVGHQRGDTGAFREPLREAPELELVDAHVLAERHGDGGNDAVEVDRWHDGLL